MAKLIKQQTNRKNKASIGLSLKETQDINQKIQNETSKIYQNLVKYGVFSNGAAGAIFAFITYNETNAFTLLSWYALLLIANFINLSWAIRYEHSRITPQTTQNARLGFIYIISFISLIWGSIGVLFISGDKQTTDTIIFLSAALICFSFSTAIDLTIGMLSIICLVLPGVSYHLYIVIHHFYETGKINSLSMSFSASFLILGIFMLLACYIGNRVILKVFNLGYINELLTKKLETINTSLEQRITERTEELEHLYSLAQATLESTQEGIIAANSDGAILIYNNNFLSQWNLTAEFLSSSKLDDILNQLAEQVIDPVYFLESIHQEHDHKAQNTNEFRLKSGAILEYYTHPQCLHGNRIGTIYSFQDITERNKIMLQASLQDRLAVTGRLVANIAHEVNNPIAWVLSNLKYINDQFSDLIEHKKLVDEECINNVNDLQSVVLESIEGAERIQEIVLLFNEFGHTGKNNIQAVDVHSILKSAINMAMVEVKYHARLETNFVPEQPIIKASSTTLHQVFLNLIINAVQSLPHESTLPQTIVVSTHIEETMFRIDIKDTGVGIPPSVISRIFEPFFTTKPVGIGTGLGLSICHDIILKLGGDITVQSTVGEGSIFSVYLPIEQDNQAA